VILPLELSSGDGHPFAVFEPFTGEDLDALRARMGVFSWGRAFELIARCAEALAAVAAATEVFHGALKPEDVWVSANGEPMILELATAELGLQPILQRYGKFFVEYRAPEQLDGSRGSTKSDIYTLGIMLFEMLAGAHPFSGASAYMATHAAALAPMPTLQAAAPGLPVTAVKTAQQVLAKALARDPQERFADMGEMARALELARRAIGSPVARPTEARTQASAPAPVPPVASKAIEDPTTMLRIPVTRVKKELPPESGKRATVRVFGDRAPDPVPATWMGTATSTRWSRYSRPQSVCYGVTDSGDLAVRSPIKRVTRWGAPGR
jgi:serine/threonine protein kinase